jgi:hypothetical protein
MSVNHSCLLLLSKPKGMRTKIRRWIKTYNASYATAVENFDHFLVLFRPPQSKTHFLGESWSCLERLERTGLPLTL